MVTGRLNGAMHRALLAWPRSEGRGTWIREDLLPALEAAGLAVVDADELERLRVEREAWRMKCPVDAEQVADSGITVAAFKHWCELGNPHVATQIARAMTFDHPQGEPGPKWWALQINRYTETSADAQRLLDEIIGCA